MSTITPIPYGPDTGTINTMVVSLNTSVTLQDGQLILVKAANTNTGSTTLAVNGGTPCLVSDPFGLNIPPGAIIQNMTSIFSYNASSNNWMLITRISGLREVSPLNFGATGLGVIPDTEAIQSAVDSAESVIIPNGTYLIGAVTIPSTCTSFRGESDGGVVFTPISTLASNSPLLTFNGQQNITVADFSISTSGSTNSCIVMNNVTYGRIFGVYSPNAGQSSIALNSCIGVDVYENVNLAYGTTSINLNSCQKCNVHDNYSTGDVVGHNIQSYNGANNSFYSNIIIRTGNAADFCISLYKENFSKVYSNFLFPNVVEGANITDGSNNEITGNTVLCATGHHDFGISVNAATISCGSNKITGNYILGPGKAGVALASTPASSLNPAYDCTGTLIEENTIINPCQNQLPGEEHAAVWLYGDPTNGSYTSNIIKENSCWDYLGNMNYAVYEGSGNSNVIQNNAVGSASALITEVVSTGTNTRVWESSLNTTFTPVVGATVGVITTASASLSYTKRGNFVDILLIVSITTNGSGSSSNTVTLPFNVSGALIGREGGVTGEMCIAQTVTSNILYITSYLNGYLGSDGANFLFSGTLNLSL